MDPIYLDHNATTPMLPEAWEAMLPLMTEAFGNPSSAHSVGRAARRFLEDARDRVADLLGATAEEVVFTSGATEANNLALFGLAGERAATARERHPELLAAPIEHPCVLGPLKRLEGQGFAVSWLSVPASGIVEQPAMLARVTTDTRLVTLMLTNHETGAIQPVRHVAKTLPKHVLIHTDAAQAIGKMPVSFRDLGVHALTASAHKFRGPKGIGLLLLKKGTKLAPLMHGGHQQRGHRPGTEPVALAVGLTIALEHAVRNLDAHRFHLERLRTAFLSTLRESGIELMVNTPAESVPSTLNVSFPGCRSELLLMSLDLAGVACSTGSACSSGSLLPSPVLQAMGVPEAVLASAMRFSFGVAQPTGEVIDAAKRVAECVRRIAQTASVQR